MPLHLWVGLSAGLGLLLVAGTGLLMVFRGQIDPAVSPERYFVQAAGAPMTLDELAARAAAAHPQSRPDFVRLQGRRDAPVAVRFKDRETLYLDPYTGRVQAREARYAGFFGRVEQVHRFFLLAPSIGEPLAGSLALVALFLVGSGLCLWIPETWRGLRRACGFGAPRTGRARWLSWHRLTGIGAGGIIAFSAATGVPQGLEWAKALFYVPAPAPLRADASTDSGALPMQVLWEKAAFLVPDAAESRLNFPVNGVAEFYFIARGAPHPNARTYLWFDARTGAVLRDEPYADAPAGYRLYYWVVSAHQGQIGGLGAQLALCAGSLGFVVLVLTGAASAFSRKFRRPIPFFQFTPAGRAGLSVPILK